MTVLGSGNGSGNGGETHGQLSRPNINKIRPEGITVLNFVRVVLW